jgi:alanine dehydrogenase
MIIGVPKEIKAQENRVGAVPAMVLDLVGAGNTVLVQQGAGLGAGVTDEAYIKVGAKMVATAAEVYGQSDMIVLVKEPLPAEYPLIKKGQLLFTYFHFAAARELTDAMLKSGANCFAYETLIHRGSLPLLTPMSEVAGRLAPQVGAHCLEKAAGGRGVVTTIRAERVTDPREVAVISASASVPAPLKTTTQSPSRQRITSRQWCASSPSRTRDSGFQRSAGR